MKLNNQQINALASKFFCELKEKYNEINEISRAEQVEKFRSNYNKGIDILNNNKFLASVEITISDDYSITLNRNESFEEYLDCYRIRDLVKRKQVPVTIDTLKNDIILATIDTSSIDEIMEVLVKKYK